MKKTKGKHRPLISDLNSGQNCRGYMILNIIVIIVIFAAIIGAVVHMSSSATRQAVSSNQSANAWNMAEAGYRFLASNYLNTQDSTSGPNKNDNADDEKAKFLSDINGLTYFIPNNGSFTLTIRPYWFYKAGAKTTGTTVTVQLPGTTPTNFTMPATGKVKIGDTPGIDGVKSYSNVSFNSATGVSTFTFGTNTTINQGDSVYLVLNPTGSQTIARNDTTNTTTLTLDATGFTAGAFPGKDGLIEIGSEVRLYRYEAATLSGTVLTLTNLQHSDKSTFNTNVTTSTVVTFKKFLIAQSRGRVGPEERTISYNQAITDSAVSSPPVVVKLDTINDLNNNFSRSSSITSYDVTSLNIAGGGSAVFSIINSLSSPCGAFWFKDPTSIINKSWSDAGRLLSYDVQVKTATGKYLTNATVGLAIRAKKVLLATEPDAYLAVTFMKYSLPNLYFNRQQNSATAILPGDVVTGQSSGATGRVQGASEITSGSWAGGNAVGKLRFASVSGTFTANEWLTVNGNSDHRVRVNGANYFPAVADNMPDGIKPRPADFSPARYNIGPLLLVLWEKKSDGTFRWLAYKDITYDDYVKGLQDWNEPDGSCICVGRDCTNCPENDGQVINDNASLYLRIEEKKVVLGGQTLKVNDINVFYGDDSSRYTTPARPGNNNAYDINYLRQRYTIGSPFEPVWVTPYLYQWEQTKDFFSHLESGTPSGSQPQFQWDAVNPNVTDISVLRICNDASAQCTGAAEGTLRLTQLVTPDSGSYAQPEIGLLGCGNFSTAPYATAGFAEFALKPLSSPGHTKGGFLGSSISW